MDLQALMAKRAQNTMNNVANQMNIATNLFMASWPTVLKGELDVSLAIAQSLSAADSLFKALIAESHRILEEQGVNTDA